MKEHTVTNRTYIIAAIGIVICMLVGTFFDYQINEALFNLRSVFGNIMAAYGEFPIGLCMILTGFVLLVYHDGQKLIGKILCIIASLPLFGAGAYFCGVYPRGYLEEYLWPSVSVFLVAFIGAFIVSLVLIWFYKYTKGVSHKDLRRFALVMFILIIGALLIINAIKVPWGRPRMRLIAENSAAVYQPWYVVDSAKKASLLAQGVAADELKSFPSGHTANAAVLMGLSFIAMAKKDKTHELVLFLVGLGYALIVAFSRMIMGAHFLTDVTIGFATTLLLHFCLNKIFYKKARQNYDQKSES